jgi:predicted dinucleotide-binding enzyme
MKIGILGSGDVAKSLGAGLRRKGHEVMLGASDIARLAAWTAGSGGVRSGSFADAAAFGELAILAVKGSAAVAAIRAAGAQALAGKAVIDATNPIADKPPVNGVLQFFTGPNESLLETLQREFPSVHFVKAFNSVGHAHMIDPKFAGGAPTMFYAGNDDTAKAMVAALIREAGWEPCDMGRAEAARAIEPLCMLWCIPGLLRNEWGHAFKLVKAL